MLSEKVKENNSIPKDWHQISLGELITFKRGHDLPIKERKVGNYPVIASNGIVGYHNEFKAKGPGVTIGRSGNLGKAFFIEEDYWPLNTTLYGIDFHESDPKFVYYFLKTLPLHEFNSGSAVPSLNRNLIHPIEIIVPKLPEQIKIAQILSNMDNKIKINQKINQTLEKIGQAIFKQWFVHFEFPNDDGKPYKSSGGEMVDSELGEIPNGWEVGNLGDLLKNQIGGDWGEDAEFDDSIPVICLRGVDLQRLKGNGISNEAPIRWIKQNSLSKRKLDDCDVLVGASGLGPVGRSLYFSDKIQNNYPHPLIYSNFCKRFRAESPEKAIFAEKILENLYKKDIIDDFITGTSIPNLDYKGLLKYEIIIPKEELIKKYSHFMMFKYNQLYKKENTILSGLRDSLLPKLMSGKIRVPLEEK